MKNKKEIIHQLIILVVSLIITALVSRFFFQLLLVRGDSMYPTLKNMQLVILEKQVGEYEAGDIIAFRCNGLDTVLIKRIVGKPGDIVEIRDGNLIVNGKANTFYGGRIFSMAGVLEASITLYEGQFIVIGDNLDESVDSRDERVGIVDLDSIIGRVL